MKLKELWASPVITTVQCDWEVSNLSLLTRVVLDLLWDFFVKNTSRPCALLSMVCWAIWKHRNEVLWNGVYMSARRTVCQATSLLTSWQEVQNRSGNGLMRLPRGVIDTWSPPPSGWLKMNTDAAVCNTRNKLGLAWILRRADHSIMAACAIPMPWKMDVPMAEALTIRETLSWIKLQTRQHHTWIWCWFGYSGNTQGRPPAFWLGINCLWLLLSSFNTSIC